MWLQEFNYELDIFLDEDEVLYVSTVGVFKIYFYEISLLERDYRFFWDNIFKQYSLICWKHLIVHGKYFLYCNDNDIRHYGEYSNTPLESTNYGLKYLHVSMDNSMAIVVV